MRDPADEMGLEAAVNGCAAAIGTFNQRDFGDIRCVCGIQVLTPAVVLRRIKCLKINSALICFGCHARLEQKLSAAPRLMA